MSLTTAVGQPVAVRRPARLDPDTLPSLVTAVLLTSTLGAVSFVLSYSGLVQVAGWASVPGYLAWTVPVTIDASILVYTLAVFIFRARGESTMTAWLSLIGFTTVSVAANAAHAWDASLHDWHGYAGAAIAGLAPVSVLLTTHTLAELIVAKPAHRRASLNAVPGGTSRRPDPGQRGTPEEPTRTGATSRAGSQSPRGWTGRPDGTSSGRVAPQSPGDLRAMRERGMSVQQIMQITGLGRSTVYRRLERDPRFLDGPPSVSAVPLATSQRSAFLQA